MATTGRSTELAPNRALPTSSTSAVVYSPDQRSHWQYLGVTVAVALWQGMIGVLVKWSTWPPVAMVWARCVVTIAVLWLFARCQSSITPLATPPPGPVPRNWTNTHLTTWGSGVLLAGHWIALFLGYRFCNVGPVVVALFTFPVMAALAEPWFFRQKPRLVQLLTAAIATAGVAAMRLWEGGADAGSGDPMLGIGLGLLSAAFFTARSIIARKLLRRSGALRIMHEQAIVVAVLLSPAALLLDASHASPRELLLVIILGVGFTAIPHTLGVWAMKKLTVATSGVVGSLQTVSTLVLAELLIGESISFGVWLGAAAVTLAVAIESLAHARTGA